jgi:hypothetical protein
MVVPVTLMRRNIRAVVQQGLPVTIAKTTLMSVMTIFAKTAVCVPMA